MLYSWVYHVFVSCPDLDALPGHCGAGLDLPLTVPIGVQVEPLGDLTSWGGGGQILLVGKDQNWNSL